ncbi:methyl-accepting chemotaxis protein [Halorhodospira halochloris]|uniref:methyl-accepting chemotaxis protein n=1 Tax=Halorhodospira halochloris TaxID=1052 RepID=UPI001EE7A5C7|nr:PAS domain-containing methyl-accepting chemotaxis protein [Halorhodospira halochloris]MCG5530856.1 methyl-accepting chemotaxis protein [Halorhodospira halochloris]
MRVNEPVTQRQVTVWKGANILSTTDPKGKIRYINEDFVKISGYQPEELVGQPHNVIRHPDMPRAVFREMWRRLSSGQSWMGLVKNRCKNGDHYWVHAYATPILNERGEITEIQSVRQRVADQKIIERADKLYQKIRSAEPDQGEIPEGLTRGSQRISSTRLLFGGQVAGALAVLGAVILPVSSVVQLSLATLAILVYAGSVAPALSQMLRAHRQAKQMLDDPLGEEVFLASNNEGSSLGLVQLYLSTEIEAVAKRLGDDSQGLKRHMQGVAEAMQTVREEAQNQSDETRSVATAMEQMSSTVDEVARNAAAAADTTQRAREETDRGKRTVEQSTEAVRALVRDIENASEIINRVDSEAERISKASSLINKITKQTHLLALNASVESARAGEAGRSFTVVAEEVRKLAGQTSQSTQEIEGIIESLQQGSAQAVKAMHESTQRAEQTLEYARESNSALEQIHSAVEEIRDMTGQIATATEQQSATANEISRSVSNIEHVSAQVTQESHNTDQRLQEASDRISRMTALTDRFAQRRRSVAKGG